MHKTMHYLRAIEVDDIVEGSSQHIPHFGRHNVYDLQR
jgi:hypothetical protein